MKSEDGVKPQSLRCHEPACADEERVVRGLRGRWGLSCKGAWSMGPPKSSGSRRRLRRACP